TRDTSARNIPLARRNTTQHGILPRCGIRRGTAVYAVARSFQPRVGGPERAALRDSSSDVHSNWRWDGRRERLRTPTTASSSTMGLAGSEYRASVYNGVWTHVMYSSRAA